MEICLNFTDPWGIFQNPYQHLLNVNYKYMFLTVHSNGLVEIHIFYIKLFAAFLKKVLFRWKRDIYRKYSDYTFN